MTKKTGLKEQAGPSVAAWAWTDSKPEKGNRTPGLGDSPASGKNFPRRQGHGRFASIPPGTLGRGKGRALRNFFNSSVLASVCQLLDNPKIDDLSVHFCPVNVPGE